MTGLSPRSPRIDLGDEKSPRIEGMQNQLATVKKEIEVERELHALKINELQRLYHRSKTDKSLLKSNLEEANKQIEHLRLQIESSVNGMNGHANHDETERTFAEELNKQIQTLKARIERERVENSKLSTELRKLEQAQENKDLIICELKRENLDLKNELDDDEEGGRNVKLKESNEYKIQNEIALLKGNLEQAESIVKKLEMENAKLVDENKNNKNLLDEYEMDLNTTNNVKVEFNDKVQQLTKQNEELKKQMNVLNRELLGCKQSYNGGYYLQK